MLGGKEASKMESIWNNELEPVKKKIGQIPGTPNSESLTKSCIQDMCPYKWFSSQGRV